MPDSRSHRGPHPTDERCFRSSAWPKLREGCRDLSWLLSRDYTGEAALKLVGDRYALVKRQRVALLRSAASTSAAGARRDKALSFERLRGRDLRVDGFNCLISVEAALGGGVVLVGMDGALRDLASVHGTYRRVEETERAARLLFWTLQAAQPETVTWYLDAPVSNSGRLASLLSRWLEELGLPWSVELVNNPDRSVVEQASTVAVSADAWVLDHATCWFDLAAHVVREHVPDAWLVDLTPETQLAKQ